MFFLGDFQKKRHQQIPVNAEVYVVLYMFFCGQWMSLNILTSTNPGLCLFFSNLMI